MWNDRDLYQSRRPSGRVRGSDEDAVRAADLDTKAKRLAGENKRLRDALEKYTHCRHGCIDCNCTTEAKAALY
jgi:hypothetical protein